MYLSKRVFWFFLILLVLPLCQACKEKAVPISSLLGKWNIIAAERNGRTTQTLESVYFTFSDETSMTTNLFGTDQQLKVQYNDGEFRVNGSTMTHLDVLALQADTLFLGTNIEGYLYHITLLKE